MRIQKLGWAAVAVFGASAQVVELAPAPRVDWNTVKAATAGSREIGPAAVGGWVDTSNRTAVATYWGSAINATENLAMGWTGAVSGCAAGDVSATYRSAVQGRINWFRGMAGVPDGIALDGTWNGQDQQAALMMSANQTLSHTPPTNWACYTAAGADAAGKSNICYLTGFGNADPGCVSGYVRDDGANNTVAGHRRWLLFPQATRMGSGDVAQTGNFGRANGIWVIDSVALAAARPATRDGFVAWPPKGYVPYQAVYTRWSISYPNADFSRAAVTMSSNGSAISSALLALQNGYGENTLVWEPSVTLGVAGADRPVNVTVSNVLINGVAQTFSYQVIVFDPGTVAGTGSTVSVTINSVPSARAVTVDGSNYQTPFTFQWTPGSAHNLAVPSPQIISDTERRIFAGWNFSSTNAQTVSPTVNSTYTINFNAEYKLITQALPPEGGSVTATPSSVDGFYAAGQVVTLNATPVPPFIFNNWSGDVAGTNAQTSVAMSAGRTASAVFISGSTTTGAGLHFIPVTPCRVADTRNPTGTFGGPSLRGGIGRSFPIPQSTCGVPSTAKAYSLNITVVPIGPLGYLTIWPTGQAQPYVSTLNSPTGLVRANAAIVPAGTGGGVSLYATNDTQVVIDINGYFDLPQPSASAFFPVTPCRVADTRNPQGSFGGPSLAAGAVRTFPVGSSACGIPSSATAYVMNVTVVPQGGLGYISTWPAGQAQPLVSTTNSPGGQVVANMAIVPAGTNGSVNFFVTNTADLVIDVMGYFGPPGLAGSLKLYPLNPCRLADTRNPTGPFGGPILPAGTPRSFPVTQTTCGLPTQAKAYSANFTVVPSGGLGYLTTWPTGAAQPYVSTLNAGDGQITANAALVPAGTGSAISIFVTNPTHLVIDTNGYFAP